MTFFKFLFFSLSVVLIGISVCVSGEKKAPKAQMASKSAVNRKCEVSMPADIPKDEPVYLIQRPKNDLKFFEPKSQISNITSNDNFYLFCPGETNSIQIEGQEINMKFGTVICNNGTFVINGSDVNNLNSINCTKRVEADIDIKLKNCSFGQIIEVGLKLNGIFMRTFKICFDSTTWTPLWSRHFINGKSIKFRIEDSSRREFKKIGLPSDLKSTYRPVQAYKKEPQINHFKELLGMKQAVTYFSATSYLTRAHLTPGADFVFPNLQRTTYFYINTCPQFKSINAGNWLRVESLARKLAQHYNIPMEIYTGTYKTLRLANSSGKLMNMYLSVDRKYVVPEWMWKVIKNKATDSAIVMITLNDPYRSEDDVEEFCTNVCARANVDSNHFKTMSMGYTFCCDVQEFTRVLGTLPADVTARNLLSCSNVLLSD